jgi:hypothetical protein
MVRMPVGNFEKNRGAGTLLVISTGKSGWCPSKTGNGIKPTNAGPRGEPDERPPAHESGCTGTLPLKSNGMTQEETIMRTLLLAGVLTVTGFAHATPISVAPRMPHCHDRA